jgi:threonine synthase
VSRDHVEGQLVCTRCGERFAVSAERWRCPCGGPLDLDWPAGPAFPAEDALWSLWRYRRALPFSPKSKTWETVSLGEGMTPLVPGPGGTLLKLDYVMPTLSFKDRGAAVLIAAAVELGVRRVVADSSGNAGTSAAAYSARAGLAATIFVPESTSAKKITQMRRHGAEVRLVPGPREASTAAAIEFVEGQEAFYASHHYNPFFVEGTKTFAFEVWEQLGGRAPDVLVLPVGGGTLLRGAARGFAELRGHGRCDQVPRIVAVQAARCAPIAWAAVHPGEPAPAWQDSVAEGIALAEPPRLGQVLDAVALSGGSFVTVDDEAIEPARDALAALGVYVEPTAATVWAAFNAAFPAGADPGQTVVVAMTGAGWKSP